MCGFGNLSRHSGFLAGLLRLGYMVRESDATAAWPLVVADALGAEAHVIAWSGVGAVWNAAGMPIKENMCALYPRLLGSEPRHGEVSAFRARTAESPPSPRGSAQVGAAGDCSPTWQPDVVCVYLGGNDYESLSSGRGGRTEDAFVEGFTQLLRRRATCLPVRRAHESRPRGGDGSATCHPRRPRQDPRGATTCATARHHARPS